MPVVTADSRFPPATGPRCAHRLWRDHRLWRAASAVLWLAVVIVAVGHAVAAGPADADAGAAFFERKVRPLLHKHCYECHSAETGLENGELVLDSSAGIAKGGSRGPLFAAGKPEESLLVRAVRYGDPELQMPPSGKLAEGDIEALTAWVRLGAVVPEYGRVEAQKSSAIDLEQGRRHWAFQPLSDPAPPAVERSAWPRRPLDVFVLERLERARLQPSASADPQSLIRRATFDLLGLPPAPEDVEAFVAASSRDPHAFERFVDRLLASPHYGERWGRYWLDLARYTDVTATWLKSAAHAWLYRDWVVRALNEDRPYDEFVRLQIAADLVPGTAVEDRAALGFLGLSPTYWKEPRLAPEVIMTIVAEEWDERVDAVSRTFLGLTVSCARCHDHKFDPVTTQDYYAVAGVFASTQLSDQRLLPEAEAQVVRTAHERVAKLEAELKNLKDQKSPEAERLNREIAEIRNSTPHFESPEAHLVEDAAVYVLPDGEELTKLEYRPGETRDLPVFRRGNPSNPGPVVPRRFLAVLADGEPEPFREGSGRRELAAAILDDARPLAARVIVNRVWQHHFGHGLVRTPSDFGAQGERPTHPELLDHLASGLIVHDWSLKWLHREIMLSATYRQASGGARMEDGGLRIAEGGSIEHRTLDAGPRPSTLDPRPSAGPQPSSLHPRPNAIDPENRLLRRMNRRRLDFEAWRDAMLAAAGTLDVRLGGPPQSLDEPANVRRTLYGTVGRHELSQMLRIHDFPEPSAHSPQRLPTTTPLQQLFVLNGPLLETQAAALAERLLVERSDEDARIDRAYRLLFARPPTSDELRLGREFLASSSGFATDERDRWQAYVHALFGLNEFLFVD